MLKGNYACRHNGDVCEPSKRMCCDGSACKPKTSRIDAPNVNVVYSCEFEKPNLSNGTPCARGTDCHSGFCRKPDETATLRLFGAASDALRGTCAPLPRVSLPDDFKGVDGAGTVVETMDREYRHEQREDGGEGGEWRATR